MKQGRLNIRSILFQCGFLFSVFSPAGSFAQSIPEVPFIGDDPCVANVEQVFSDLPTHAKLQKVNSNGMFETNSFKQTLSTRLGLEDHFQGVQKLRDGKHMVFSGANYWTRKAGLFVARIDSENGEPEIINRIDLGDSTHWHLGGLGRLGDLVAAPLDSFKVSNSSVILFYDFRDPEHPVKLPFIVNRPSAHTSSVGLVKLEDAHVLLAVNDRGVFQYYRSKTLNPLDGFEDESIGQTDSRQTMKHAQSTNFVRQCDGKIYFFTFQNTGLAAPILNGKDLATCSRFEWNAGELPELQFVQTKHFFCDGGCDFAGAAGSNVEADGSLSILSTKMYRSHHGNEVRFKQFVGSQSE